jgi:hypothetical protein
LLGITKLFREPARLIELYNALVGTDYGADTPIEINTLDDVLFNDLKNDISFTIGGKFVVLVEHQSTINANMPLRMLEYIGRVYEKITDERAAYRQNLVKIPKPEFVVLYNGTAPYPAESTLKLSDAFIAADDSVAKFGGLKLTVRVVNINPDGNEDILKKSATLGGYSAFVEQVRACQSRGLALRYAIREAIKWGIESGVLSSFLAQHSSEVENMLYTEFNIDVAKEVWMREAREDALAEGKAEGKAEVAKNLFTLGMTLDQIIKATGLTRAEIERLQN